MSVEVLDVLKYFPAETVDNILFTSTMPSSSPSPLRARHIDGGVEINRGSFPLSDSDGGGSSSSMIPVDILETSKEYIFYADVPGICKSDIQVTVEVEEDENVLVIRSSGSGKRKREDEDDKCCKYIRLERRSFNKRIKGLMRKFRLPADADVSKITAKCDNGVLTVAVEKLPPPPKSKTVRVSIS